MIVIIKQGLVAISICVTIIIVFRLSVHNIQRVILFFATVSEYSG